MELHPLSALSRLSGLSRSGGYTFTDPKPWTILFYNAGDNDITMETDLTREYSLLPHLATNLNVNIVSFWDGLASDARYDYWLPGGSVVRVAKGELNTGDPATLWGFVDWAQQTYPASHYALVMTDHGTGVGGVAQDVSLGKDEVVHAWAVEDGAMQWTQTGIHSPYSVAFAPAGDRFLLYELNQDLQLRDSETGTLVATWEPGSAAGDDMTYGSDGSVVITTMAPVNNPFMFPNTLSYDRGFVVRAPDTGRILRRVRSGGLVRYFGAQGTMLFVVGGLPAVEVWGVPRE